MNPSQRRNRNRRATLRQRRKRKEAAVARKAIQHVIRVPDGLRVEEFSPEVAEVIDSNASYRSYLVNLTRTEAPTPRSWLFEDKDPNAVLSEWLSVMRSAPLPTLVYDFDARNVSKFGPQGGHKPLEDVLPDLVPYFTPSKYDNEHALLHYVTPGVKDDFLRTLGIRRGSLRPKSFERIISDKILDDGLTSNSGYPMFVKRANPDAITRAIDDARSGEWKRYPATLLLRSYQQKTRIVWMYPFATNLVEFAYAQPLLDALRRNPQQGKLRGFFSPWEGFTEVKRATTKQWKSSVFPVGGDTTKMDAHFRKAHSRLVFELIKDAYDPALHTDLYEKLMQIHEIPIIVGPNMVLTGSHGLASGSGWTQLVETVFQAFIAFLTKDVVSGQAIGDDLLWFTSTHWTDQRVVATLDRFGLPANSSKQSVSEEHTTFLQRLFIQHDERSGILRGIYPTVRALNSLLFPERFHNPKQWNSDMFCVRTYEILENAADHPLFETFVKFVVRGNKDLIPFAKKRSSELDKIQEQSRAIPQLNPTYNHELRNRKLSMFESIKIAGSI